MESVTFVLGTKKLQNMIEKWAPFGHHGGILDKNNINDMSNKNKGTAFYGTFVYCFE